MRCPRCGADSRNLSRAKRFRPREHGRARFRWYECAVCALRFPTMEFPIVTERDAEAVERLADA